MSEQPRFGKTEMIVDSHEAMTLPNTVVWSTARAKELLGIEQGKQYAGALFLREPGNPSVGTVGFRQRHHRSFNVPVAHQNGEEVHVSMKGSGYYNGSGAEQWHDTYETVFGLMSMDACEHEWKNSLRLKSLGVRVVEPLAVVKLDALPVRTYGGATHIVPVDVLKAQEKFEDPDFEPGVLFRLGNDTRIEDVIGESRPEQRHYASESLKKELPIVLAELKKELGVELTPHKYIEWFADMCGRNFGKMHAAGVSHHYASEGNVTIDARVIDTADFQDCTLPDMSKPLSFANAHEALQSAQHMQNALAYIERDIDNGDERFQLGVFPMIIKYASYVLDTFPESFTHDIDEWEGDRIMYYLEQLCPELDDIFWRAYLEEHPNYSFKHQGFNFPRQGEKSKFPAEQPSDE